MKVKILNLYQVCLNLTIMNKKAKYFISIRPQTNEYHSVHKEDCPFLPEDGKRISLGSFESPSEALAEGHKYYGQSKCCLFCSKEYSADNKVYKEPVLLPVEKLIVSEVFQIYLENALFCAVN